MDLGRRLTELARLRSPAGPVVSVYLDVRWADEQQRDRVRLFLKNELRRAREGADDALGADLDWIEERGRLLIEQALVPDANGVALFACGALRLREILPVRVSLENAFVLGDTPWLKPLAAVLEEMRPALVVFVDGESARLLPLGAAGPGEELVLQHAVEGRHSNGGWAALAQSRYQRHIEAQRDQHFEAVASAVTDVVERDGIARIVVAGEPRAVAAFRKHLGAPVGGRVVGVITGTRWEPAGKLGARAADLLSRLEESETTAAIDAVLDDAAKGQRAVAGLSATLDAVRFNAVQRLYLLRNFETAGRVCTGCGTLEVGADGPCPVCDAPTRPVDLGSAMVDRVISTGGTAETVANHARLAHEGRVAARLRFAA